MICIFIRCKYQQGGLVKRYNKCLGFGRILLFQPAEMHGGNSEIGGDHVLWGTVMDIGETHDGVIFP